VLEGVAEAHKTCRQAVLKRAFLWFRIPFLLTRELARNTEEELDVRLYAAVADPLVATADLLGKLAARLRFPPEYFHGM